MKNGILRYIDFNQNSRYQKNELFFFLYNFLPLNEDDFIEIRR